MGISIRGADNTSVTLFVKDGQLYYKDEFGIENRVVTDTNPVQSVLAKIKHFLGM